MSEADASVATLAVHEFALGGGVEDSAILIKTLMILILAMPPLGSADRTNVRPHNNVKRMKAEVLKRIPIESSIERAKEVMEKSGFDCEMMWNESFAEYDDEGNWRPSRSGEDFLHCDREKTVFPWICSRRWQIAIVHKDRLVKEVFVAISETCP